MVLAVQAKSCLTLWDPMDRGTRFLCPPPSPGVCSNECPLSRWRYRTISSSATPFSFSSVLPSIRIFTNELALRITWPKYWSFSFTISPSSKYLGLISFRVDWLDLLAVQGILKSPLQHHNSKASILWCSALFMVQLSSPYMTTGKIIALFVSKLTSLIFNTLSRFVIGFLPRSKHLLISRLQSPSARK